MKLRELERLSDLLAALYLEKAQAGNGALADKISLVRWAVELDIDSIADQRPEARPYGYPQEQAPGTVAVRPEGRVGDGEVR